MSEYKECPACGLEDHPHQTCAEADRAESLAEQAKQEAASAAVEAK